MNHIEQKANLHDIKLYIQNWDEHKPVYSVVMGGFSEVQRDGPDGYDIAIQSIMVELLRKLVDDNLYSMVVHEDNERREVSEYFNTIIEGLNGGYSGAMEGAAKQMAYQFWVYGLTYMLDKGMKEIPDRMCFFTKPK